MSEKRTRPTFGSEWARGIRPTVMLRVTFVQELSKPLRSRRCDTYGLVVIPSHLDETIYFKDYNGTGLGGVDGSFDGSVGSTVHRATSGYSDYRCATCVVKVEDLISTMDLALYNN